MAACIKKVKESTNMEFPGRNFNNLHTEIIKRLINALSKDGEKPAKKTNVKTIMSLNIRPVVFRTDLFSIKPNNVETRERCIPLSARI